MRTTLRLLAVASMLAAGPVAAQVQIPPEPAGGPIGNFIAAEKAKTEAAAGAADPLPALPDVAGMARLDPETRTVALEALREYYRYRQSGYEHRRRVFEWQLLSSRIIFVVVILMVSAGIYFSGVQFHLALRGTPPVLKEVREVSTATPPAAEAAAVEAPRPPPVPVTLQTSFEAGTSGVKVSSPVLGVIILVISFLFFYMYLVHVYPISEIM